MVIDTRAFSLRELLRLGLWIGLIGGFAEVIVLAVSYLGFHHVLPNSIHVIWAAPLSLGLLSTAVALPLGMIGRSRFVSRWPFLPLWILCFIAVANFTPPLYRVDGKIRLLLMAAIALQTARLLARHRDQVTRLASRTLAPLLVLVGLLAAGLPLGLLLRERSAIASLPAHTPGAPNVLLIVLDTERAQSLSLYGYDRRTALTLERVGGLATVFDRAYATSSWTLPSHASMFTGRLPLTLGTGWFTPLDSRYPTLAETFAGRGYLTAAFSANTIYVTRASGLSRGFAHFEDFRVTPLSILLQSGLATRLAAPRIRGKLFNSHQTLNRKNARRTNEDALAWLDAAPRDRPYFVFINLFDVHHPYLPPAPFDTAFIGRQVPWNARNLTAEYSERVPLTRANVAGERDAYDQAIAAQDAELGVLLNRLEDAGRLRNTIIAITSDHGEEFGEHALVRHSASLNPASLWVPLLLVDPAGRLKGVRVPDDVSLIDLPATLLELADSTRPSELPGFNLLEAWAPASRQGPSPVIAELVEGFGQPKWFPASRGPLRSVTRGDWHYIVNASGEETLMELSEVREGRVVRRYSPAYQRHTAELRAILDSVKPGPREGKVP